MESLYGIAGSSGMEGGTYQGSYSFPVPPGIWSYFTVW